MGFFLTLGGGYYEGDREHVLDREVPQRPSPYSAWDGAQWVTPTDEAIRSLKATARIDGTDRLQFEHLFNLENRVRALEGKVAITKAQYRDALIARAEQLLASGEINGG